MEENMVMNEKNELGKELDLHLVLVGGGNEAHEKIKEMTKDLRENKNVKLNE